MLKYWNNNIVELYEAVWYVYNKYWYIVLINNLFCNEEKYSLLENFGIFKNLEISMSSLLCSFLYSVFIYYFLVSTVIAHVKPLKSL